eukprot:652807-Alexandrium_andersonii.AAC.1
MSRAARPARQSTGEARVENPSEQVEAATPSAIPDSAQATTLPVSKTQPRQYRLSCLRTKPASIGQ